MLAAPIAVSEAEAAALVSVSLMHFRESVREGLMPAARSLNGRKVYLVAELEAVARTLPPWEARGEGQGERQGGGLDDGWGDAAP
jgi:hypothetical protein